MEQALEAAVEARAEIGEVFACMGQVLARVVMQNGGGEFGDAVLALAKLRGDADSRRKVRSSSRWPRRCSSAETRDSARLDRQRE